MSAPDFYRIVRVSNGRRLYAASQLIPDMVGVDKWVDPKGFV